MIGRLRGELIYKQPPSLLLDVNGVGYELEAPMSTFYTLPEPGVNIILYTHLVVREDAQNLFGFASESERGMFRALLKINGVGARMGLAILSTMTAEEFAQNIRSDDVMAMTRVPGIGKKTAERLIVEMRDRLDKIIAIPSHTEMGTSAPVSNTAHAISDAVSALIALGYKAPEASRMVRAVKGDELDSEALIRASLQATDSKK